ncbi:MAG: hypothetical protein COV76_00675 [Candidatus Omnitrophica bacterium CG11_big_fil_rev_8_21_14_0_20_64_10]|nr:MAG: hypothetical protein COV76_00675 [Candidatus Omnitrophica bacterium CG11_big_fil_rev_8_21_14_0_20_64_10]
MSEKFRRKRYLTDLSLQLRYMFLTLFLLLGFLGIAIVVVYITGWSHLVERLANVYPQGRLVEILNLIYLRLAMGFLLLLPVALGLTLFYTHNVAGPLVRIKRYLRLMARGEFDLAPLYLRRFDELKEVASLINEISSRLGPRFQERKKLTQSLAETVQQLRGEINRMPSVSPELRRKADYLAETLRILE